MSSYLYEKIDALRELLDARNRQVISVHSLVGLIDVTTNGIVREVADSGDRAYVFLGPKDKLGAVRRELADGSIVYEFTIPPS